MSFKITGLDEFAKRLTDVAKALEGLGGDLCTVKFDPNDPFSLEAAVVQMEQTIDAKVASYRGNKIVEGLIGQAKDKFRQDIYDRAAKARAQDVTS
jgi:hypothetical protein